MCRVEVDLAASGLRSGSPPRTGIAAIAAAGIPTQKVALCRKGGLRAAAGRTLDLLRACRRTLVRTTRNRPAYRAFSLEPADDRSAASPVQSDTTQTHLATAPTKKACKCRPFAKRLMGFEPSTFCMASRTYASRSARIYPANARVLVCGCRSSIPRLSPGVHGGLGTQWAPGNGSGPDYVLPRYVAPVPVATAARAPSSASSRRPPAYWSG